MRLSTPVTTIEWGQRVVVEGVAAGAAIVAMSPALAGRIRYAPALPGLRDQLTQHTPQGAVIKCHAVYDEPFWRRAGPHRPGGLGHGPGEADLRQLAARRVARRTARVPRGRPRARAGHVAGAAAQGRGDRHPHPPLRPARRHAGRVSTSRAGPTRSGPAAATAPISRPAPGPRSGRRCARRSARCTGPAPSTRSAGAATWTAPCAPARPRRWRFAQASRRGSGCDDNYRDQEPTAGGSRGLPDRARRDADGPQGQTAGGAVDPRHPRRARRRHQPDRHRRRLRHRRERGRSQRAADRQGPAGPLRRRDRRHQGRSHPPGRRLGARRPPRAHPRGVRGVAEGARHRPHRPLPVPPPGPERPLRRDRGRVQGAPGRGQGALDRPLQLHGRAARGGAARSRRSSPSRTSSRSGTPRRWPRARSTRARSAASRSSRGRRWAGSAGPRARARSTRSAPPPRRTASRRSRSRSPGCSRSARP